MNIFKTYQKIKTNAGFRSLMNVVMLLILILSAILPSIHRTIQSENVFWVFASSFCVLFILVTISFMKEKLSFKLFVMLQMSFLMSVVLLAPSVAFCFDDPSSFLGFIAFSTEILLIMLSSMSLIVLDHYCKQENKITTKELE
ncbi:MAG: hypothetical protein GY793_00985 [Proteobacteria bacterium]|nr:hypothetical protein [Pseudomonadota bacterium]